MIRLRVLTISHFYEAHGGGIERVAGHLCRQFVRLGATPVWAASDSDELPGVEIEAVPLACFNPIERLTGLPMPLPGVRAIARLIREVRLSNVVLVHDALYVTSIIALLMAKVLGKRVILIQHIAGIPFSSFILRRVMALANMVVTRPMLWAADVRVFISDTVRHDLLGTPARYPHELLFNGVDAKIFHPDGADGSPSGAHGDISSLDAKRLLFVGRYVEKKGLTVLRALADIRPNFTFLMAGSGPIRPSEWGLANVHDLGAQHPQALADLYRSADLLLLPSVGEGYPLVMQEAMACGLPVICGEPTNRADPEMSGWIRGVSIDLNDPTASSLRLAQAIDGTAWTSMQRAEMARKVLHRYDWKAMAERLLLLARNPSAITPT